MQRGATKIIRDVPLLTKNNYDVLVIGGDIQGACIFWEAALRGLSVALVEQNDFASAISAQSFKIIYGASRYLPKADFKRIRISTNERTTLMRIAPHLVHPMPVIMPIYGHGFQGKAALGLAMHIDNLMNSDRNRAVDAQKLTPNGRTMSKGECLDLLGDLPRTGLQGAAMFHDAQVYNSERLVLAFLKSGAQIGGDLANYVKAIDFICEQGRVIGIKAVDQLSGENIEIRARMVVNTAPNWNFKLSRPQADDSGSEPRRFASTLNVVTRKIFDDFAVGFKRDENDKLFFVAPWRDHSIIGTSYAAHEGDPEQSNDHEAEINRFLEQINRAYPPAKLTREDVKLVYSGLIPALELSAHGGTAGRDKQTYTLQQGGFLAVDKVQYTTARHTAVSVVDEIFALWERQPVHSASATTPLRGGEMQSFSEFLSREMAVNSWKLSEATLKQLIYNYGSDYPNVLDYLPTKHWGAAALEEQKAVLTAQIHHAVYKEMALKLSDVIFRRTELASAELPDNAILTFCAETMGKVLDWEDERIRQEITQVNNIFARMH